MVISKSNSTPFTLAPKGTYQAVCVDIIDEGEHPNTYQDGRLEQKLSVVFQLDALDENNARYRVSRWFTHSLHERSALAAFLCEWHDATYAELPDDFDLEELIGRNARLRLIQEPKKNKPDEMKVVIKSIEPVESDTLQALDYERIYKREPREENDNYAAPQQTTPTNKFRPNAPVQPVEFMPATDDTSEAPPRRVNRPPMAPAGVASNTVPAGVDPRSVNPTTAQSMKAAQKAQAAVLMADDDDDSDPFADDV